MGEQGTTMSRDPLDLELSLRPAGDERWQLGLTLRTPGGRADENLLREPAPTVRLDLATLRDQALDVTAYGQALSSMLFAEPWTIMAFIGARQRALGARALLRVRLALAPGKLDELAWEMLRDPARNDALGTAADVLLTRFVPSAAPDPGLALPTTLPAAVVAVAAPSDLASYGLAALTPADELSLARAALGQIAGRTVAKATLTALVDALRGSPAILYLVCHGAMVNGEPVLYLEREDGRTHPVEGSKLVTALGTLALRPSLVVLASCVSAGVSHGGAMRVALGPQLAEAGIGAVVAMRDQLSIAAARLGLPVLFAELASHGRIDRAVTAMRQLLAAGGDDWWQPVLFLRWRDGRLFAPAQTAPSVTAAPTGAAQRDDALRKLIQRRLNHLRMARAVEVDAAVQFKLDIQIEEAEEQLRRQSGGG